MPRSSETATIRIARSADAAGIARVHVESWRTTYRGIVPDALLDNLSVEKRTERWKKMLEDAHAPETVFVATLPSSKGGEEIVGWATCGPERSGDPDYRGELGGIYLLKEFQRRGVGRRLVSCVAKRLLEMGFETMLLWVLTDNHPSRRFYERLGGVEHRRQPIEIGEATLEEIAYVWRDVRPLILSDG
jgi:ribosomal protein S18 acetylase RimI-like enzyme